jgi:hypothetical protein
VRLSVAEPSARAVSDSVTGSELDLHPVHHGHRISARTRKQFSDSLDGKKEVRNDSFNSQGENIRVGKSFDRDPYMCTADNKIETKIIKKSCTLSRNCKWLFL